MSGWDQSPPAPHPDSWSLARAPVPLPSGPRVPSHRAGSNLSPAHGTPAALAVFVDDTDGAEELRPTQQPAQRSSTVAHPRRMRALPSRPYVD